jgi:hypothetical protein
MSGVICSYKNLTHRASDRGTATGSEVDNDHDGVDIMPVWDIIAR